MSGEEERRQHPVQLPCDGVTGEENGPCIEYLQRAVVLLLKNERMRFELFVVRNKIACIERAVFGAGSHGLRDRLPSLFVGTLRDLCCGETASDQHGSAPPATGNDVTSFQNDSQSIVWMQQMKGSADRRE
jgi:hypothetical protein